MTVERFTALRSELNKAAEEVLQKKGYDYTQNGNDKLMNFKSTAAKLGLTPMQITAVFLLKQIDALCTLATFGSVESEPPLQRFVDARNYIDLMYACFIEAKDENKQ